MNYERQPKETCHALRETLIAIEADFHDNWIKDTAHVKPIAIDRIRLIAEKQNKL